MKHIILLLSYWFLKIKYFTGLLAAPSHIFTAPSNFFNYFIVLFFVMAIEYHSNDIFIR